MPPTINFNLMKNNPLNPPTLDLTALLALQQKPAPFTPGEPLFWDDPHISAQMLTLHLDPNMDLASRRPETIDRTVEWIIATLGLHPGDAVLDLGCGPGLYTSRLAGKGLYITGVDYSHSSIDYATSYARDHGLNITYRYQNYLELTDENQYEAALLIFGDYCPLNPEQRSTLLANVHRALKPGGHFVLDVSTPECHKRHGSTNHWSVLEGGFWKPGLHLLLDENFEYPEQSIYLDQAIILEVDGKITVYRNWFQDYTPDTITAELTEGGFVVESLWGDLTGMPYTADSEWIGLVTRKA
jgi:SAM-dependent methyltransferase